ncbi:hypothetical protein ACFTAO_02550 [Paenibacillus rhizoplanae]
MEIKGESVPFAAGDVTFLPRYLPHTTYSSPGEASLWSYLFFSRRRICFSIPSRAPTATSSRIFGRCRAAIVS